MYIHVNIECVYVDRTTAQPTALHVEVNRMICFRSSFKCYISTSTARLGVVTQMEFATYYSNTVASS